MTDQLPLNRLPELYTLPISRAWQGHGSTVFLELGDLREQQTRTRTVMIGEAHVSVSWDWVVTGPTETVLHSESESAAFETVLRSLEGQIIDQIEIMEDSHELHVQLSNGYSLKTITDEEGNHEWGVKFSDDVWLFCEGTKLGVESH